MFGQIAEFLVDAAAAFFVFLLLARFHFQWLRVPFRNPIGEFVVACTNWIVHPARRVIPSLGGLDLASWLAAWLIQGCALYVTLALRGWDAGSRIGAAFAGLAALAFVDLLRFSVYVLVFAVIVQVLLSWLNPYHPFAAVFDALTRRFLRPLRRVVPPIANIDLSPLLLIILLQVLLIPLAHLREQLGRLL
ncbi:MAG: YggT family protein [Burkholderiales bacterium]|nr:YggT family protein [Burkholderiales bacterium]